MLIGVNVLHDRNPLAVQLSDGAVRNSYPVRLLNKRGVASAIDISVEGLEGRGWSLLANMPRRMAV